MNLSRIFFIVIPTRRVGHRTVALFSFVACRTTSTVSTFIVGRTSMCYGGQRAINFNYKNIIVLYDATRCFAVKG